MKAISRLGAYSRACCHYAIHGKLDVSLGRQLLSCVKLGYRLATNRIPIVDSRDFAQHYDSVARDFPAWPKKMGHITDQSLDLDGVGSERRPLKILDFACGSGYLTQRILGSYASEDLKITGVDISKKLIGLCNQEIDDERAEFLCADGLQYLRTVPNNHFDALFCSWALAYIPTKTFLQQVRRTLKHRGTLGLVLNVRGTMEEVERCVLEIIIEAPDSLSRFYDASLFLPCGKSAVTRMLKRYSFEPKTIREGVEEIAADHPDELYRWLDATGELAGVKQCFVDQGVFKQRLTQKIGEKLFENGRYRTYQKYVCGVFEANCQR